VKEQLEEAIARPRHAVLTESGEVMTCDLFTWANFFGGAQRIILQEELGEDHWISTVFMGVDLSYWLFGPPLWFETMIFRPSTGAAIYQDRYTTLKEALEGHERAKRLFERDQLLESE
jgi:hypothetical protein